MSKNYDNWERLVRAVLDKEKLRQLALRSPSTASSQSSSNDFPDENSYCLVASKELQIAWGDDSRYWNWTSQAHSRFPEVAELKSVWWLDIRGKIETRLLSPETTYAAFLVFKLAEGASGLGVANATVRFVRDEQDNHAEQRATVVHLQEVKDAIGRVAVEKADGWMEVEIGSFSFQDGYEGEVEARLMETTSMWKTGLIVESIEFRQVYAEAMIFSNRDWRSKKGRRRRVLANFTTSKINESFAVDWERFLRQDYLRTPLSVFQDILLSQRIRDIGNWLQALSLVVPRLPWRQKSEADSSLSEAVNQNHVPRRKLGGKFDIQRMPPETLSAAIQVHRLLQAWWAKNLANSKIERPKLVLLQPLAERRSTGEMETETAFSPKIDLKRRGARGKGVASAFTNSKIDESFALDWERFLMPDYQEMISPSVYRGFLPYERNGKICYMLGARGLQISWGDNPDYWGWKSQADSRFSEVAELNYVWWLDIRGKLNIQMLSPRTCYAAFLVFRLNERKMLKIAYTSVRFVEDDTEKDAEKRAKTVKFQPSETSNKQNAVIRGDGWMEIEMGNFYLDEDDEGEVEARLSETKGWSKSGLIVEGIEFRPVGAEGPHTLRKGRRISESLHSLDEKRTVY